MRTVSAQLRRTVDTIGQNAGLDEPSVKLAGIVQQATSSRLVKNALSGTWVGHALHPALTDVPIGAWMSAAFLDLTAGESGADAARKLVGLGVLAAVPAAATGANDWSDTYGPEQRIGLVHATGNIAATTLQAASWLARRNGRRGTGVLLSLAALGLAGGSAYLGGHLTLGRGVGVNHTAFEHPSDSWIDVAAGADIVDDTPTRVTAGEVPVLLVRSQGRLRALSAVCTHAGGPLDEGTLTNGCVRCPWHGSEFWLDDGAVERGPAAEPQPVWEAKVEDGRVYVRSAAG